MRHARSEILARAILFQNAGKGVEREASATTYDDRLRGDHNCDSGREQPGMFLPLLSELAEAVRPFFAPKRGETLMFVLRRKETFRWRKQCLSLAVAMASVA